MNDFENRWGNDTGADWLASEIFDIARERNVDAETCSRLGKFAHALAETVAAGDSLYLLLSDEEIDFFEKFCKKNLHIVACATDSDAFSEKSPAPLVFDKSASALYFFRHYKQELDTAGTLSALANEPERVLSSNEQKIIDAALPFPLNDGQKNAVHTILSRRIAIISGGPGTGKTSLLLRALLCILSEKKSAKIVLAAPTGKAASRMKESIAKQTQALFEIAKKSNEKIAVLEPATLHRILRIGASLVERYQPNKIDADFIFVDEASMIDQALAARLCNAISDETNLVLIGDENQLDAVGPGHVFGALCATEALRRSRVYLTETRRFRESGKLGELAHAVVSGDTKTVAAIVSEKSEDEKFIFSPEKFSQKEIDDALVRLFPQKLRDVPADASAEELLDIVESVKLLTPLRNGAFGTQAINARAEKLFAKAKMPNSEHYHGRPIIISRNASRENLFNGDLGIVLREGDAFVAFFRKNGERALRRVPVSFLPEHETAYALSVHKAQGSEFSRLTVLFPPSTDANAEFFTRELLYTAISRFNENAEKPQFHLIFDTKTLLRAVANTSPCLSLLPKRFPRL